MASEIEVNFDINQPLRWGASYLSLPKEQQMAIATAGGAYRAEINRLRLLQYIAERYGH